ncbi:prepilin-type N-terminal cleavage/methylation domain-containing protein [Pseudoalteromonas sp. GB56]
MSASKKHAGMTLPEILVVLIIMSASFALVAPVTINTIEKRQAKQELVSFKSNLEVLQRKARWSNRAYHLVLNKGKLQIKEQGKVYLSKSFKHLRFEEQTLTIFEGGLLSSCRVEVTQPQQTLSLNTHLCQKAKATASR